MRLTSDLGEHLATPSAIEGTLIRSRRGDKIGAISSLVIDEDTGRLAYVIIAGHGRHHPIPFQRVAFDPDRGEYIADFDKAAFDASPAYERDQLLNPAYGWGEHVRRHYEVA